MNLNCASRALFRIVSVRRQPGTPGLNASKIVCSTLVTPKRAFVPISCVPSPA